MPTADEDSVALKPPCSGDKGYFVSDVSNEKFKVQPTNFNSGDMFWASNYKVNNDAKLYVQEDVDSKAKAKNEEDCTDGRSIATGLGVLDLQRCGKETTFGNDETLLDDKCKTTCPPFAVLEDGSLWTWGNDAGGRLGHPAPRGDGPVACGPPSAGTNATPRKVEALAAVHVMQACVSDFHGECFRE